VNLFAKGGDYPILLHRRFVDSFSQPPFFKLDLEEKMAAKEEKSLYWLIGLLLVVLFAVVMAYQVRSDFGKTEVTFVRIPAPDGHEVTARLYRPKYATAENKLPAVVDMHGGNNDKDTQAPAAIELSRRGFVVLAVDMDGHGDNTGDLNVGAAFSGNSFLGVDVAYDYVKTLPYVDATRIGLTGHSLGGMMSTLTALARPDHFAVVPQDACGQTDLTKMHNYLCIKAAWESDPVSGRDDASFYTPAFYEQYGFTEPIEANYVYGDFEEGTAFMIAMHPVTHPGMPPSNQMVTTLVDWMRMSLKGGVIDEHWIPSLQHIYVWYDIFMGLALLAALGSVIPLTNLLLAIPFFASVAQPMPKKYIAKPRQWWQYALLNAFIAGITYPFFTQFGWFGTLGGWFQNTFPFLNMLHPNGILVWMIANAIIFAVLFTSWYRKNQKANHVTMFDLGVSFDEQKTKFDWTILGKTLLLAVLLMVWLYILVSLSVALFGVEFRVEYPTLKTFPEASRLGQFFIYLIPVWVFMLLNNGLFLFGQARQPEYETERKTQIIWWLKNIVASLTFLAAILALQNIPIMVFNTNYGYDLVGLTALSASIGASAEWMMAIVLWYLIPLFIVLLYFLTWFFRKTGRIYLGSTFVALIVTWIWVVGNNVIP
jgi:pimeloyl-ACP methyl ester carboxylesterase